MADLLPLEIAGGGLAGLALGLALRRQGVPVTLFEAGSYPRHRVCGEFITGLDERTVDRLGLGDHLRGGVHHREVAWFERERPVQHQRLPAPALGISRYTLDARLAAAFTAAGGILKTHHRVEEAGAALDRPGRVRATGRRPARRSAWIGLKVHLAPAGAANDSAPEGLEVHLGQDAYVGVSAVEDGRVNVCGFFRRRAVTDRGLPSPVGADLFLAYLRAAGLAPLADRIAPQIDPASGCAVAGLQIDRHVRAEPGLSIGDACAMTPPFTGNGMAMAFQSAETALDPLLAYARRELAWPNAGAAVRRALSRRFSLRLASASLLHPYLLHPPRQRLLAAAAKARVLPLRPLYALLH